MGAMMHGAVNTANSATEQLFGKYSRRPAWLNVVMRVVHGTWTAKRAASLALAMGTSTRAAEHVLSGRNAPSSDALIGMLRSGELGPQLLDALLGDLDWYQQRINLQRIGEAEAITRAALRDHEDLKAKIGRHRR